MFGVSLHPLCCRGGFAHFLKDWISFDKQTGSMPGDQSDTVIVTIDTNDMGKGKEYSGTITIDSNDETKTIPVSVITSRIKTKNYHSLFNLIEDKFPFIIWLLRN